MFNQSMTITGIAILVLSQVFTADEANTLVNFALSAMEVGGILLAYWGRYRQGDITFWGKKL